MASVEEMRSSRIRARFDPAVANAVNQRNVSSSEERLKFSGELMNYQSFLQSDFWQNAVSVEGSDGLLFSFMEQNFGDRQKFIYEEGGGGSIGDLSFWGSLSAK